MGAHEFVPGEVVGAWYVDGAAPPPVTDQAGIRPSERLGRP
jgi:hypothetical protein